MQTASTSGLRAQLPARRLAPNGRTTRALVCRAQQQQQQREQQPRAPFPSAATAAALAGLLTSAPAWAEEADAAAAASGTFAPLGITPAGWALTLSPVIFYALFNAYRSFVDPRAKFGDAVFAFAALLILTNIICITVFKIRIW